MEFYLSLHNLHNDEQKRFTGSISGTLSLGTIDIPGFIKHIIINRIFTESYR